MHTKQALNCMNNLLSVTNDRVAKSKFNPVFSKLPECLSFGAWGDLLAEYMGVIFGMPSKHIRFPSGCTNRLRVFYCVVVL